MNCHQEGDFPWRVAGHYFCSWQKCYPSTAADIAFNSGNEFAIDSGGWVTFDSSKLGETANTIADIMNGGFLSVFGSGVGFVAYPRLVFTITSTIGTGDALKAGHGGQR